MDLSATGALEGVTAGPWAAEAGGGGGRQGQPAEDEAISTDPKPGPGVTEKRRGQPPVSGLG